MENSNAIEGQVRHMRLTGGTGILITEDGKEICILATTIRESGAHYIAKNENGEEIKVKKSKVKKAKPS